MRISDWSSDVCSSDLLDAVVNNAGILRDRIFHKMSQVDWDDVIRINLNGYYYVSKATALHFKDQGAGAFVHFTSTSGLIGNFGQANYSEIGRATCRDRVCHTCRSRVSTYH